MPAAPAPLLRGHSGILAHATRDLVAESSTPRRSLSDHGSKPGRWGKPANWVARPTNKGVRPMLLLLALIILLLAIGGGIFLSKFLFLVILVAILVAFLARRTV
jgi:hypothetical protein